MTPRTDRTCKIRSWGTINLTISSMSRGMSCRMPGEDLPVYRLSAVLYGCLRTGCQQPPLLMEMRKRMHYLPGRVTV